MWESRVLRRAFERLELHEGKLSRAVLRGGGGGDVTSLPDPQGSNPLGPPGPSGVPALGTYGLDSSGRRTARFSNFRALAAECWLRISDTVAASAWVQLVLRSRSAS